MTRGLLCRTAASPNQGARKARIKLAPAIKRQPFANAMTAATRPTAKTTADARPAAPDFPPNTVGNLPDRAKSGTGARDFAGYGPRVRNKSGTTSQNTVNSASANAPATKPAMRPDTAAKTITVIPVSARPSRVNPA